MGVITIPWWYMPSLCCRVRDGVHAEQIIRPGPGKTAREYPILRNSTMKKTLMMLLAALMLGGEVLAMSDQELVDGFNYQVNKAERLGFLESKLRDFFSYWIQPHQRPMIYNWVKQRANTNEGIYKLFLLGMLTYDGFACQMNRQLGIQYVRQAAQLGVRDAAIWLNQHGIR